MTDSPPPGLPLEAVERTAALVLVVDRDGHIVTANDAALAAIRMSRKDAVGKEVAPLLTVPKQTVAFVQALRSVARTGLSRAHEHEMTRTTAGLRSLAWSTSLISSDPIQLACVGVDVSAARVEAEDLLAKAQTDELTGLSNRAHLIATLAHMQGSGAAVLFCDLNGFKAVNDAHGHAAGDAVLVEVARRLRRVVRGEDFVARLGGDEFIIIAPPHAAGSAESLARRILATMRQPMIRAGGLVVVVGVSIGTAELAPGQDPVAVLRQADAHMYSVKSLRASRAASPADVDLEQQRMATTS